MGNTDAFVLVGEMGVEGEEVSLRTCKGGWTSCFRQGGSFKGLKVDT